VDISGHSGFLAATIDGHRSGSRAHFDLSGDRPTWFATAGRAKRWENSEYGGTPSVTFRPSETGYVVAVRNEWIGSTQLLVDIDDAASGSSARCFKGAVVAEGVFDKAVIECQQP
jgi:hypothetical protein